MNEQFRVHTQIQYLQCGIGAIKRQRVHNYFAFCPACCNLYFFISPATLEESEIKCIQAYKL